VKQNFIVIKTNLSLPSVPNKAQDKTMLLAFQNPLQISWEVQRPLVESTASQGHFLTHVVPIFMGGAIWNNNNYAS
jgi:hypothetical protein